MRGKRRDPSTVITRWPGVDQSGRPIMTTIAESLPAGSGSGDVVGPASAVNNRVVAFDGVTGKLIKDSGILSTDVVQKTRLVSTGSGLTGGGDLSADRTLAADFGSGAGKVTQGNDARLSDTRTPTDNSVSTVKLQDDAVTYAKLQNLSATARALGRKTAGAGDTEELTISDILDFIGSAARGDLLARGAATWARLALGAANTFLRSDGTDPAYARLPTDTYAVVYATAAQSLANGTWTPLNMGGELLDTDAMHSTVTNTSRITVPAAGTYLFIGQVWFTTNAAGTRYVWITINGDVTNGATSKGHFANQPTAPGGYDTPVLCMAIESLAASDYAELSGFQDSGGALNAGGTTRGQTNWFAGIRVA